MIGDVLWHYIEENMGTSIERILGTSSGRSRNVILLSGKLNECGIKEYETKECGINFLRKCIFNSTNYPIFGSFIIFNLRFFKNLKMISLLNVLI